MCVARLGDGTLAAARPRRVLGWHQAEKRHELTRILEPAQVAEFREHGGSPQDVDTGKSPQGFNRRTERPVLDGFADQRRHLGNLLLSAQDHVEVFLQYNLLVAILELLCLEPAKMGLRPSGSPTRVDPAAPEQEGSQPLPRPETPSPPCPHGARMRSRIASSPDQEPNKP